MTGPRTEEPPGKAKRQLVEAPTPPTKKLATFVPRASAEDAHVRSVSQILLQVLTANSESAPEPDVYPNVAEEPRLYSPTAPQPHNAPASAPAEALPLALEPAVGARDKLLLMAVEDVPPFTFGFEVKLLVLLVTDLEYVGTRGMRKATVVCGTTLSNMIGLQIWIRPTDSPDTEAALLGILNKFKQGMTYVISGVEARQIGNPWHSVGALDKELFVPDPHAFTIVQQSGAERINWQPDFSDDDTKTWSFEEFRPYNLHFFVWGVTPKRVVAGGKVVRNIRVSRPRSDQSLGLALWGEGLASIELREGDYIAVESSYKIKPLAMTTRPWSSVRVETPPTGVSMVPFNPRWITCS